MNVLWEQNRFLATMIHNVNCSKKSEMIQPKDLFKLPQDDIELKKAPKSTREEFEKFQELVNSKLNKK